jgi:hypothetical protein
VTGSGAGPNARRLAEPDGPHVRLGILWGLVTLAAMIGGPIWLAAWLAPAAGLAAASAVRSWQRRAVAGGPAGSKPRSAQPPPLLAGLAAAAITLAAAGGVWAAVAAGGAVIVAIAVGATVGPPGLPGVVRRCLVVLAPACAAAALVLTRAQGLAEGLVLVAMISLYDSAAYLIGTEAGNAWVGPAAGLAGIGALTLFVAAVLVPPFEGSSPWILGGLAAVLAPMGPVFARWLTGDTSARVPALRRLDTLMLLGPAWAAATALVLHV